MSAPFGGHPTFAQYLLWAREREGCTVQTGIIHGSSGRIHALTRIVAPNGKWVIDIGTGQHEYLVPTQIAHFDRRLGLNSGYFSLDG